MMDHEQLQYAHALHVAWKGTYDASLAASLCGLDGDADDLIGMARLITAMQEDLISGDRRRRESARQMKLRLSQQERRREPTGPSSE